MTSTSEVSGATSSSTDPAVVPNVVGMTESAAETALHAVGLQKETVLVTSQSVPTQDVISESPVAGSRVAPKSFVVLTISLGPTNPYDPPSTSTSTPSFVVVPNVVGMSDAQATSVLTRVGLAISIPGFSERTVASQSPAPNTRVRAGSTVTLKEDNRKSTVSGPTCEYLSDAQARALLGAGTISETQRSTQCTFFNPPSPTAHGVGTSALIEIDVQPGTTQLVQDELNPNWSVPAVPNGLPPVTRHFSKFEGTRIAYVTSGNSDPIEVTSNGNSLPGVSIFTMRGGNSVVVDVSGHTHPLVIAERLLAKVFARS